MREVGGGGGGERSSEFPFISLPRHLKWNGKPAPTPKSRMKPCEEKTRQFPIPILDLAGGEEREGLSFLFIFSKIAILDKK